MNEVLNTIIHRRSVRRYKETQLGEAELNLILEAGLYGPNSGGRQAPVFGVCQDAELNEELGAINVEKMKEIMSQRPPMKPGEKQPPKEGNGPAPKSFFYGAPTVVTIFAPKDWYNFTLDAAVCAQNMMLAADSLGIGSCMIARAKEVFETERGKEVMQMWGISDAYEAKVHVLLGYAADEIPEPGERLEGRIKIIK